MNTLDDPELFADRYAAYAIGSGRAIRDGVVDIAVLGYELIDLQMEQFQVALKFYGGTEFDFAGNENLTFIGNGAEALANLDSDAIYTTIDKLLNFVERRFERQAGSGEKGLQEALGDTGYVFTTILGGEEIAFRAVALGVKGVKIIRLGRADDVLSAGSEISRAADNLADTIPPDYAGPSAPPGPSGTSAAAGTVPPGTAASRNIPEVARSPEGAVLYEGGGERVFRNTDGEEFIFGERLGGGATSEAFAVAGRPDIVIKATTTNPGVAGQVLDDVGYRVINEIDPSLAARQIGDSFVIDGKSYAVFERADSFQSWRYQRTQELGLDIPTRTNSKGEVVPDLERIDLDMTPGQALAYRNGMAKLTDNGFVFVDNKIDNWSLVKIGEPDEWAWKVIDPGSIIKMTPPDAARAAQAQIDFHPDADSLAPFYKSNPGMLVPALRGEFAQKFDQFIDVDGVSALGADITSFGEVPFNPVHALQNPSIRQILDVGKMTDSQLTDLLRGEGWDDAQISELIDLPPAGRAEGVRAVSEATPNFFDDVPYSDGPDIERMSDQEFAEHLRRSDPGHWTPERIREYIDTEPTPIDFGDDIPTQIGAADGPGQGLHSDLNDAVIDIDGANASTPTAMPPGFGYRQGAAYDSQFGLRAAGW